MIDISYFENKLQEIKSQISDFDVSKIINFKTSSDPVLSLLKLQREYEIYNHFTFGAGKEELEKIESSGDFCVTDSEIIYKNRIYLNYIICNGALKKVDEQILANMGYKIDSFRIKKDLLIYDVYCEGTHPNVNRTKLYVKDTFRFQPVTLKVLNCIRDSLDVANLDNCYLSPYQIEKIKEITNIKRN